MNAIVDVYLDNNFGDDLMGEILVKHLQSHGVRCYLLANDEFTYSNFVKNFTEIDIVESLSKQFIDENNISMYVRIGGSMFQHNTVKEGISRYRTLLKYWMLKRKGVKIYILGCNVGPFRSSVGITATKQIIRLADMVTCRDKEAHSFISKVKRSGVYIFPDIVLSKKVLRQDCFYPKDTLGISTYTGYTKSLKNFNYRYCETIIEIINRYLDIKPQGKVKLFVFDGGYNSDYPTTHKIYSGIKENGSVEIIGYNGNINEFLDEYSECSVTIGTRFHSVIISLLLNIPILPVVYSNKTKNLLDELGYIGPRIEMTKISDVDISNLVESIIKETDLLSNVNEDIFYKAEGHLKMLTTHII